MEEITIDGINASECKYLTTTVSENMFGQGNRIVYWCDMLKAECKTENCVFKQLEKALNENNILKHQLKANENRIKDIISICKLCIESEG